MARRRKYPHWAGDILIAAPVPCLLAGGAIEQFTGLVTSPAQRAGPRYAVASPSMTIARQNCQNQAMPKPFPASSLARGYHLNKAGNVHQPRLLRRSIGAMQPARDHELQAFGAHFVGLVL